MGGHPPEVFRKITKIIRLNVKSRLFFGLRRDADRFSFIFAICFNIRIFSIIYFMDYLDIMISKTFKYNALKKYIEIMAVIFL